MPSQSGVTLQRNGASSVVELHRDLSITVQNAGQDASDRVGLTMT